MPQVAEMHREGQLQFPQATVRLNGVGLPKWYFQLLLALQRFRCCAIVIHVHIVIVMFFVTAVVVVDDVIAIVLVVGFSVGGFSIIFPVGVFVIVGWLLPWPLLLLFIVPYFALLLLPRQRPPLLLRR